jgi:hypothetical protein
VGAAESGRARPHAGLHAARAGPHASPHAAWRNRTQAGMQVRTRLRRAAGGPERGRGFRGLGRRRPRRAIALLMGFLSTSPHRAEPPVGTTTIRPPAPARSFAGSATFPPSMRRKFPRASTKPPRERTTTIRPPAQGRARHLDGTVPPESLTQTPPLKVQHPWDDYPPAHPRELPPSVVAAPLYL